MKSFKMIVLMTFFFMLSLSHTFAANSTIEQYQPDDINEHWAVEPLSSFVSADLLKGYDNGNGTYSVKPNNDIKRAEFVAILIRALNASTTGEGKLFSDVNQDDWFYDVVRIGTEKGYIGGVTDNEFQPNRPITRAEIATIIVRAFGDTVVFKGEVKNFPDVQEHWAKKNIDLASQVGIIGGYPDGKFGPDDNATRAEAIVMLERAIEREQTSLPSDETLTNVVLNEELETINAFNDGDFDQVYNVLGNYTTGFYKVNTELAFSELANMIQEGMNVSIEQLTTPNLTVIKKSDRFAEVELMDFKYNVIVQYEGTTTINEGINTGVYLLKKMPTGEWKIYNYYQAF